MVFYTEIYNHHGVLALGHRNMAIKAIAKIKGISPSYLLYILLSKIHGQYIIKNSMCQQIYSPLSTILDINMHLLAYKRCIFP